MENDGKAYCEEDYFNLFGQQCAGCNQPITGSYITAVGSDWHEKCFVCKECHKPFEGGAFYEYDGMPYCELHIFGAKGNVCTKCHQPITQGQTITTAGGKKYHREHFNCFSCSKILLDVDQTSEGYKEFNSNPYCIACYVKISVSK